MTFQATIRVDPAQVIGEVHPHLYGANLEHIGQSVYGGHWAEMLKDRKFAGHDRMYLGLSEGRQHESIAFGVVIPWEPMNPDPDNVRFVHDNSAFYSGRQSQRITVCQDDGEPHGIRQTGMVLSGGGRGYEVKLVLKGNVRSIEVLLGDQKGVITGISEGWATYRALLRPEASANGTFSITFRGAGTLWIGSASVMPDDNLEGHRADLIAALRDWTPTFLRWPGGNFVSAYHWMDGIGPRDTRPTRFDPVWSLLEPNDVGTDEFVEFCRLVGSEPVLTVNMGDGTPEEAAAWVEYCNGDASTEYGALRAANGYREPHNVRTWFVGNEQFGNWQVGHCDAETYARAYLEFAAAMRAKDPDLKLIGVGVPGSLYGHWNELVLRTVGAEMDELSIHYYSIRTEKWKTPPPPEQLYLPKIAAAHEVAEMLDETIEVVRRSSDPPVPIAFDEWNTYVGAKAPSFIEDYNLADALYTASLMNACIQRCDKIKLSAVFNLINVMGNYRATPEYQWTKVPSARASYWVATTDSDRNTEQVWKMPSTLVMELMTKHRGELGIRCEATGPHFSSSASGNLPAYDMVPYINAAATYDPHSGVLYLYIVNRDTQQDCQIAIEGVLPKGTTTVHIVSGDNPLQTNTELEPEAIRVATLRIDDLGKKLVVPKHSVAVCVVQLDSLTF